MWVQKGEKVNTPSVIFENTRIMVLYKPSGWIVNSTQTSKDQPVIQDWLKQNFHFSIASSFDFRSGIVHRLDKETSGVLLVAKTEESFEFLQMLFRERKVKKRYIALVHGKVEPAAGTIEAEVGRLPWNRRRFGVLAGGRQSKTTYKVDGFYKNQNEIFTLVNFYPETGRTHQIRIHAKHIGHALVGDSFYAGRKTSRKDRLWCPRIFLHAAEISFFDKVENREFVFQSELPRELKTVIDSLEAITKPLV